jgi:hypothetical protein
VATLLIIGIIALTSLVAYFVGTRGLRLRRDRLTQATMEALECLGLAMVFLMGNLATGVALTLGLRALTGRFLSIYWLSDISVLALSFLEALILQSWLRRSR